MKEEMKEFESERSTRVPFLGCAPAPIREGRRKRQKWERGDMSGAWWGKNKKKGREGGYVGGGGKKGKEKKIIIIIKFKSINQNYIPNTIFF